MSATTAPPVATIFDRIVCGVDGSEEALEAARQAERLRSRRGTLWLAAVADLAAAVHAGYAMSHVLDEFHASARNALERATEEVHPAAAELLAGDRVTCLLDEIERADATLVSVGPRGHSRAAGMLIGGLATELLHRAQCSVLFARRPLLGKFPSSIVVGVDGSPESLAAAAVAKSLAERFGSEHLIALARGGKGFDVERIQALTPYPLIDPGHPVDALVGLAKQADLLVVGSRGLHGLRALGSVSERVAHRAPCSVLVVRNAKEES